MINFAVKWPLICHFVACFIIVIERTNQCYEKPAINHRKKHITKTVNALKKRD